MNRNVLEGRWFQRKGRLKICWGRLTDDLERIIDGRRDVLAGRFQKRYAVSRAQAEREIDEWWLHVRP